MLSRAQHGYSASTMTEMSYKSTDDIDPCVRVYGTRVHNLRGVDVVAPRDALVAFTGISCYCQPARRR
jgi:excinuclease ABC subunit A